MDNPSQKSALTNFRRRNPRIDYYPTPEAAAAIERLRQFNPGVCIRELIDTLVLKGEKAFFPDSVVGAKNE